MDTKTNTFSFAGLELRSIAIEGKPWFVATDVCRILGLSAGNVYQHVRCLDPIERRSVPARIFTGKRMGNPTLISERGLYKLVMRAQTANPQAREFQSWVTGTVLPASPRTSRPFGWPLTRLRGLTVRKLTGSLKSLM